MTKRELVREDGINKGENMAVRTFLMLHDGVLGTTIEGMKRHMEMSGWHNHPEWAKENQGLLTKAKAQEWIRHLFELEKSGKATITMSASKDSDMLGVSIEFFPTLDESNPAHYTATAMIVAYQAATNE